jgi:hypothetical protein
MIFEKNFTGFPTRIHRAIYNAALRLTPLDVSLTDITDPFLIESCRQYHAFLLSLLSDMYADPHAYGMIAGEYETYLNGRHWEAVRRIEPSKVNKHRTKKANALPSYFRFFLRIAQTGTLSDAGKSILLPTEAVAGLKAIKDGLGGFIPYEVRVPALTRVGFIIAEKADGSATVTSENFPDMMFALSELGKSEGNTKTFGEHNFFNCEFRQIGKSYIPTYDDVMRVLPDDRRAVIDEINRMVKKLKLRASCSTYWKVNYHYKGKHIMCIGTDSYEGFNGKLSPWCNSVNVRVNGSHRQEYLQNAAAHGAEFVKYFHGHLPFCRACSKGHIGAVYHVLGKTTRLCCGPSFRVEDPSAGELDYIRKFIELRIVEINAGS